DLQKRGDGEELPHLQIEGDALTVWAAYNDRVEHEMREGERLAAIREWASKQPGRVARLAGVLHLIEMVGTGSSTSASTSMAIPAHTVEAACRLGEYFEAHALAAYDMMAALPQIEGARRVLAWITRTRQTRFSARDAFSALARGHFPTMAALT